jgi:acyl-CoA thioester hydrolase
MEQFPVTLSFPMHWGDMDALGHANNACFLRWFESARIECVRRIEAGGVAAGSPVGPILAHIACDYLRPLVWPAQIVVGVRVTEVGRTSVKMGYLLWREDEPEAPCARGESVIVIVRYATGEKVPIDDALRARLETLR